MADVRDTGTQGRTDIDLDVIHPDYTATASARAVSRHLFDGDAVVKAKTETYLFREKNETDADYELRLKRAVLDPYVEKIVGARQAILFAKPHDRELPAGVQAHIDDVDRRGTPASVFFSDAALDAQVDGVHWVLVDMPRLPDGGFVSRAAEQDAGHRPYMVHLPADAVIDWEVGDDQALLWAVVRQSVLKDRESFGEAHESRDQWLVWTRDAWYAYERPTGMQAGGGYVVVGEGLNPTGRVPLVPFLGVPYSECAGWPVARSVLGHVLLIYNKTSDLDWFERLAAHPIACIISPEKPDRLETGAGLWLRSSAQGAPVDAKYLETSGNAFGSLRESISALERRIYAIALAQAKRDSAQVQSGDSQREDRKAFTSSLKSASLRYQHAEQRCWDLMALWAGGGAAPEGIDITYSRDFDDRMIEAGMISAFATLVDSGNLTKKTLLQILKDGEVLPESIDIDEELAELEQENAAAAAAALKAIRAASQQPGQATGQPMNPVQQQTTGNAGPDGGRAQ